MPPATKILPFVKRVAVLLPLAADIEPAACQIGSWRTASAGFALLCFYANLLVGSEVGVDIEQYKGIPATYGLQYEGNILAAYCGALAVMMMIGTCGALQASC